MTWQRTLAISAAGPSFLSRPLARCSVRTSCHRRLQSVPPSPSLFSPRSVAVDGAMEPLVCVVPQSLRVLVERLPAYIAFLEQQGYSVYRQVSLRLSAQQAHMLFARTQDELFSLHTPVAVLLLERKQPYAAWQAVREQLDIVYGSPDRKTAMDDIYQFFAAADSSSGQAAATKQPPQRTAVVDTTAVQAPPPPPPPPSGPPPPQSDSEDDDAMDGAFLAPNLQPALAPTGAAPPPPPALTPLPLSITATATAQPQSVAATEQATVPPPPPPAPSQFQWEEMESDAAAEYQPTSASPRPSSPSDSPVAFHASPDSPQHNPRPRGQQQKEAERDDTAVAVSEAGEQQVKQQKTTSEAAAYTAPRAEMVEPATGPPAPPQRQSSSDVAASTAALVSPLQQMSETKRGSLSVSETDAAGSQKGPLDLLALPSRMSIKERLAALNLAQEPAPANNSAAPAASATSQTNACKPAYGSPSVLGGVEERRASVSMQQKQATLSSLLAKAARLSLDKTPVNGARAIVPPSAVHCPFASIAALTPNGPIPGRPSHSRSFEYSTNLPSSALLLAAGRALRGVLHHMTGDEDEWGQRFVVLHLDSLYIWPTADQRDEPQSMICVSEPTISLAYAEGVIEVKGAAGGRHLLAAELPDIERWYDELSRAKIELASEDKRRTDEADGRGSRRSSLNSSLAAIQPIAVSAGAPFSLQQQVMQLRQASGVAGVGAVRNVRDAATMRTAEDGFGAGTDEYHLPASTALPSFSSAGAAIGMTGGAQLDDTAYLRSLLLHGALFTKYKYRRGKQRWVWCSPALDTLYWSEEKGRKVKGQLSTATVTGVADGCVGVKRKGVGLTVVAEDRTLDLEARDEEQQKDWLRAIGLLINLNRQ